MSSDRIPKCECPTPIPFAPSEINVELAAALAAEWAFIPSPPFLFNVCKTCRKAIKDPQ